MNFQTPERGTQNLDEEEPTTSSGGEPKSKAERRLIFSHGNSSVRKQIDLTLSPCDEEACCSICLSPLRKNGKSHKGKSYVTPCGHEFHFKCLQGCREFKNSGCPLCRMPLPAGLTPVGARERQAEREREEETAFQFNISADYNPNFIAVRAARIRYAVAHRYYQQEQNRRLQNSVPTQIEAGAS